MIHTSRNWYVDSYSCEWLRDLLLVKSCKATMESMNRWGTRLHKARRGTKLVHYSTNFGIMKSACVFIRVLFADSCLGQKDAKKTKQNANDSLYRFGIIAARMTLIFQMCPCPLQNTFSSSASIFQTQWNDKNTDMEHNSSFWTLNTVGYNGKPSGTRQLWNSYQIKVT